MLAGVGEGVGDDAADDVTGDEVRLGEALGDGVPDGELAEDEGLSAEGFAAVEAQAVARAATATAHNPERILEALLV